MKRGKKNGAGSKIEEFIETKKTKLVRAEKEKKQEYIEKDTNERRIRNKKSTIKRTNEERRN